MSRQSRVTLKDVAQAAGVSLATVSHALRGNGTVSERTATRVREIASEIGYRPHLIAVNLRRQRTFTIGVIIPALSNPFLSELIEAVYGECRARGYTVLCGTTNYDSATEAHYIDLFLDHPCDGIIVAGPPDRLEEIIRAGVPAVLIDCHMPSDFVRVPVVEVEDMHGMYSAVAHLQRLGHETIGLVYGPLDQLRQEGYRRALVDAGREYEPDLVADAGQLYFQNAASVAVDLLAARPEITAIATTTDVLAFGVLQAARVSGRRVPEDLAVVGFDDIPLAAAANPPLTTIAQPVDQIVANAVELLLEQVEARDIALDRRRIMLKTQLVVRQSCGADRGPRPT
jgi:LacI family transcriptional regulator, repressor for deo operon, udp, cdd, tsx, nupC, and nupG